MRCDFVTIFPEYFAPLELSLIGKARAKGILDIRVHDLRDYSPDRRVDDTPYGGGAGMVMQAEPWAQILQELITPEALVIFPSPAGELYSQRLAQEFSQQKQLIFCCGRYEGIDRRVYDWAAKSARVAQVSLGDYVLNGGEAAALAMFEAAARLIPEILGNPDSIKEESHQNGLLEYPAYTKPVTWRGLEVPEILLSGHHEQIARWRHQQQVDITRRIRPDLYQAWLERQQ